MPWRGVRLGRRGRRLWLGRVLRAFGLLVCTEERRSWCRLKLLRRMVRLQRYRVSQSLLRGWRGMFHAVDYGEDFAWLTGGAFDQSDERFVFMEGDVPAFHLMHLVVDGSP